MMYSGENFGGNGGFKTISNDLPQKGIVLGRSQLNSKGIKALQEIMDYQNESVIERFMEDNNETIEVANAAFYAVKQYLAVCALTEGYRTPALMVDEMWHVFILHMQDYRDFCNHHLRQIVYHDPSHDGIGYRYYEMTRECVIALFGEADVDQRMWPSSVGVARCISKAAPAIAVGNAFADCLVS